MRILIADSGATKTDWACLDAVEGKPVFLKTAGLHPAYLDLSAVVPELKKRLARIRPDVILFYGAGCYSEPASEPIRKLMDQVFGTVRLEIYDDLTAIAHAFFPHRRGLAAILGTGSASGLFEEGQRKHQVPSLGYILGDEGSAADMGKRILRAFLRREFSEPLLNDLSEKLDIVNYEESMKKLYSTARPSYYLAGLARSALSAPRPDEIDEMLKESFRSFVDTHLKRYEDFPDLPVVISGGLAIAGKEKLAEVLQRNSVEDYTIVSGVIHALAEQKAKEIRLF